MPTILKRHPKLPGCGITESGYVISAEQVAARDYVFEDTPAAARVLLPQAARDARLGDLNKLAAGYNRLQGYTRDPAQPEPTYARASGEARASGAAVPNEPASVDREARLAAIKASAEAFKHDRDPRATKACDTSR